MLVLNLLSQKVYTNLNHLSALSCSGTRQSYRLHQSCRKFLLGQSLPQQPTDSPSNSGRSKNPRLSSDTLARSECSHRGESSRMLDWYNNRQPHEEFAVRGHADRSYHDREREVKKHQRDIEHQQERAAKEQERRLKEQRKMEKQERENRKAERQYRNYR